MKRQQAAASFLDLFGCRRDVYAVSKTTPDGKGIYYLQRNEPLTEEVVEKHLQGTDPIAIFPLVNEKVKWMAVDVDGDTFEEAFTLSKQIRHALEIAGLHAYIERSKSGTGAHVWVFLQDWVPAKLAQKVMTNIVKLPRSSYDKIYPVQTETATVGSHLAAPFNGQAMPNGNSLFVDDEGKGVSVAAFFTDVLTNVPEIIERIAKKFPDSVSKKDPKTYDRTSAELEGALKLISPFGCRFMRHAWENRKTLQEPLWYIAIQQCTPFRYGREFAHAISRDYPKYSESEVNAKFDQALKNPPMSCTTIRERYPDITCTNCTCKFPYEVANKSLLDLASSSSERMELLGSFQDDLKLIEQLNSGVVKSGVSWGIEGFDDLSLLRPSELTIIGGLPSIGKSWILTAGVLGQAQQGIVSLAFSPETAERSLRQRMLAHTAKVELMALRGERNPGLSREEIKKLDAAAKSLEKLPVYTDYSTLSTEGVILQVERTLLTNDIPLDSPYVVWFDYLQFGFRKPGENDVERISRMASEFKIAAKALEHPVVNLSQLVRGSEDEEKPTMTWFAGSSSIERNMDSGIIITGERIFGEYAQRTLTQVKQREGRANQQQQFILNQGCGDWKPVRASAPKDLRELLVMEGGTDEP